MDSDGLGWSWAPDGTQPVVGGEDALRAFPADAAPADAAARRPGDVVIPAVPLGDDPRLAADAVTRWMDDDRARRDSTPPTPPPSSTRPPNPPAGEGAVRPAPWRGGAPHATAAPSPLSTPSPPAAPDHHGAPARDSAATPGPTPGQPSAPGATAPSAAGWVPVVALMVMLLVIAMVVVLGAA